MCLRESHVFWCKVLYISSSAHRNAEINLWVGWYNSHTLLTFTVDQNVCQIDRIVLVKKLTYFLMVLSCITLYTRTLLCGRWFRTFLMVHFRHTSADGESDIFQKASAKFTAGTIPPYSFLHPAIRLSLCCVLFLFLPFSFRMFVIVGNAVRHTLVLTFCHITGHLGYIGCIQCLSVVLLNLAFRVWSVDMTTLSE